MEQMYYKKQMDKKQMDKSDIMDKTIHIIGLFVVAGLTAYISNKIFDKLGI